MATTTISKTERLNLRVNSKSKALLQDAARVMGVSLSDFILQTVTERAQELVQNQQVISLSQQATRRFLEALDQPVPQGLERLSKAPRVRQS
jgi:uncharacterized protein (DUF1778 family)